MNFAHLERQSSGIAYCVRHKIKSSHMGLIGRKLARAVRRFSGFGERVCDASNIKSERLRAAALRINRANRVAKIKDIPGWLSPNEARAIYALAKFLDGPFLEIGAWAGRSTCCIASAIRDSGVPKRFVTVDLNPTLEYFRPHGGGIGFFNPPDSARPLDWATVEVFDSEVKPILVAPGGVLGVLRRNLERLELSQYVEVREGAFASVAPSLPYSLVFVDTLHNPEEIDINAPLLRPLLRSGALLACHDMTHVAENEERLRAHLTLGERLLIDSLLISEVI
jgi:predicted O-methyltransferase YrrM